MGRFAGVLALVLLFSGGPLKAESFEEGLRAYRAGQPDRARDVWMPLAESGDAAAQYSLGKLFEHGEGPVAQDLVEAVRWYREAASQGLPAAQNNLGLMYAQGRGVPGDLARAIDLWSAAAGQSYPWAQYNLALAYFRGQGVTSDKSEAATWFRRSAEGGLAEAQFIMGQLHREGMVLRKDHGQALTWYQRAAEQGHLKAKKQVNALESAGIQPKPTRSSLASAPKVAAAEPKTALPKEKPRSKAEPERAKEAKSQAKAEAKAKSKAKADEQPRVRAERPKEPAARTKVKPKTKAKAGSQSRAPTEQVTEGARRSEGRSEGKGQAPGQPGATRRTVALEKGVNGVAAELSSIFRVWLASASNETEAAGLWRETKDRHPEIFSKTEASFARVQFGDRTLVRVLAGPLASSAAAERLCQRLRSAQPGAFCKVKPD